jgi:hypothetical protein
VGGDAPTSCRSKLNQARRNAITDVPSRPACDKEHAPMTIDLALDDYLHVIVRTRPWTKKREEELLEPFSAWLFEQPDMPVELPVIAPEHAARYADAVQLDNGDRNELLNTLHLLYLWATQRDIVDHNPFAPVAV